MQLVFYYLANISSDNVNKCVCKVLILTGVLLTVKNYYIKD
jgi:hypothetical protein